MAFGLMRRLEFAFWRFMEPRAIFEWQSFYALRPLLKTLKKGDGHPVIVFPGFGGSDRSTKPLRGLLSSLGYQVHGWGLGSNVIFNDELEAEMVALVEEVAKQSDQKVSLVGWSLGGLYAREIAKICPESVRGVITMGSPISGRARHSNAQSLFQALNGEPSKHDRVRQHSLHEAPPVPTTSVYSKTDGIVAWEGSVQKTGNQIDNIQVPASHLGFGVNPLVMVVLADRLALPENQWRPFDRSGLKSLIFKQPDKRHFRPSQVR